MEILHRMSSNKSYLLRAFYDWIVDNRCTPLVVIKADPNDKSISAEHLSKEGEITFNISPEAIRDLHITTQKIQFLASFSGVVRTISVFMRDVLSIYAQENGQGMIFDYEEDEITTDEEEGTTQIGGASHLTVIK